MKRYVTTYRVGSFANFDDAIADAKKMAENGREPAYVLELVGAVHPGKPRWRPTERKERVENSVNPFKKLF